jgi:hypothetical protein
VRSIEDGMKEGAKTTQAAAVVLGRRWWEKERRKKLKKSERWAAARSLYPAESGGRPMRAPCPMRDPPFPGAGLLSGLLLIN